MKAYALTNGSETSLFLNEADALAALKLNEILGKKGRRVVELVEVVKEEMLLVSIHALAALKAQWQAEAVQSILDGCAHWSLMGTWGILVEDISEKLEELCQRTQEADDVDVANDYAEKQLEHSLAQHAAN